MSKESEFEDNKEGKETRSILAKFEEGRTKECLG